MCRVEERVYIGSDGRRQIFEDKFPCDKSHKGKLCSKVKRRTTEYFPKQPPPIISRDNTSSPLSSALSSNNPPTPPAGTGNYLVETRRPSVTGARPSTRDSKIVIEFNGGKKDGKSKKYPLVTVNKSYKRSSFGATSVTSNEGAIESPGSEASYTVRTGFADVPVPPNDSLSQAQGYRTRHDVPNSHHRHVSSSSSQTTSSQPPSLYATSEPESPANSARQLPVYPRTIVHNPPSGAAPPSPSATRAAAPASPSYRTKTVSPQKLSRENVGADGLTPLDYSDFIEPSASSHASSGRAVAPEITDRAVDRERRRKHKDEEKKRQEEADRRYAEDLAAKEEVKQVRFELGRAEDRAKQRGEQKLAESEKRRAEEREDARRRKKEAEEKEDARRRKKEAEERDDARRRKKEAEERDDARRRKKEAEERDDVRRRKKDAEERPSTKKPEREKTKPPTRDHTRRHVRRTSMTQADIDERNRLRLQEEAQMAREREATEIREREERAAALRQSQQMSDYWDPRAPERYPVQNNSTGIGRRGSVSGRRPSVSGNPPPVGGLGRSNSTRRVSIIQPAPPANLPPLTNQFPQQQQQQHQQQQTNYSTRATNSQYQNPAPLFSPSSYNAASRPPSARHHSQHDNPFAQPPTRTSHSSQDSNPFTLPSTRPMHPSHPPVHDNPFAAPAPVLPSGPVDPWDNRDMRDALPFQTLQRRGEEVISRAEGTARRPQQNAATAHGRAQQATRNLGTAQGFADAYESSSEEDEMKLAGKGARMGFGKSRRY